MTSALPALLRMSFLAFARKAAFTIGVNMSNARYLAYLAWELQSLLDGRTNRLLVNLPPRHLKTVLCSICFAAWILAHRPWEKLVIVTYSESLAEDIARAIRKIMAAPWYKEIFATRVAPGHSSVMDFATTAGGSLLAISIAGSLTGRGGNIFIADDIHDIKDAGSLDRRRQTIDRFHSILLSRPNDPSSAKFVVTGHRICEDDLSGHLIKQGGWRHAVLPLIAPVRATYVTEDGLWTREQGELLRPDAYSLADIEMLRKNMHNPSFELLYQQGDAAISLPSITADTFGYFTPDMAVGLSCVMSIDAGVRGGARNAYTAIQIWSQRGEDHLLIDQSREQCTYTELEHRFHLLEAFYRPAAILVEATANGTVLLERMTRRQKARAHAIVPRESKIARFLRHIETITGGRILLPLDGVIRQDYVPEIVSFPHGRATDQVDTTTQYLDFVATNPRLTAPPPRMVGSYASRGDEPPTAPSGGDTPRRSRGVHTRIGIYRPRG